MKKVKCPDCKREFEVKSNSIMCICKCGETIDFKNEVKNGREKSSRN